MWRNYKKIPYIVCIIHTTCIYEYIHKQMCMIHCTKERLWVLFSVLVHVFWCWFWDRNQIKEQNSSVCTSSQGHFNDQIYTSNIVQVYKVTWLTRLYQQHISFLNLNANSFKCFLKKGCVQHNSGSSPTMKLALQGTKNRRMVLRPSKWLRNM